MAQNSAGDVERMEPDIRPLGALALGAAIVSAVLSVTYFVTPLHILQP